MIPVLVLVLSLAGGLCEVDGEQGFLDVDGVTCWTPSHYDEVFSNEALADVPSYIHSDKSVAEVYEMDLSDETPASERPLGEGLVEETFTFKEYVGHLWSVAIT